MTPVPATPTWGPPTPLGPQAGLSSTPVWPPPAGGATGPCRRSVAQSCPTLCSLPGSFVYGMFQARLLECIAIFLLQGIFPAQGSNPRLLHPLHQQVGSLTTEPPGEPLAVHPVTQLEPILSFFILFSLTADLPHPPASLPPLIKGSPLVLLPLSSLPGFRGPSPSSASTRELLTVLLPPGLVCPPAIHH